MIGGSHVEPSGRCGVIFRRLSDTPAAATKIPDPELAFISNDVYLGIALRHRQLTPLPVGARIVSLLRGIGRARLKHRRHRPAQGLVGLQEGCESIVHIVQRLAGGIALGNQLGQQGASDRISAFRLRVENEWQLILDFGPFRPGSTAYP